MHKEIQNFSFAPPPKPTPIPHVPQFPMTVKNNQQCYSSCTWFVHKPYFEYNACKARCLNQTYEDTNLHLLSVWRGFPYRNEGPGFPIQLKASQMQVANDKIEIKFLFLFCLFFLGESRFCSKLFLCPLRHIIVFFRVLAAAAITAGVSV